MSEHAHIDMISFTGSTRAGIDVARRAAETVKRVSQELGGKSPNIILDDASFAAGVTRGAVHVFENCGQSCNAPTRMLVQRDRYAAAVENANAQNSMGIKRPSTLVFSRQGMPNMNTSSIEGTKKGAYTVVDEANPDVILVGTGSELEMAVKAGEELKAAGKKVRVVSMPCWELYDEQPQSYKDSVLTPGVPKVSVEAGSTFGWAKYVDASIGIDEFGASAPAPILYEKFGITQDAVVAAAKKLM